MSNVFAALVAKPCGTGTLKKFSGNGPFDDVRKALTIARMLASSVAEGVRPLAVAQALYSAVVIGTCVLTPPIVSAANSVGTFDVKPAVPDEFAKRKVGWLKALIKSTLKLIR